MSEIPIVTGRNQRTGDYQFYQTHVEGVIGLDDFVNERVVGYVDENQVEPPQFSDTGWIEYDVERPLEKNTKFNSSDYNSFKCSYRIISMFSVETFYIRFNLENIKSGAVIKLPDGLITNAQSFVLRTGTARLPVQVSIKADGTMTLYPNGSDSGWSQYDYIYQEVSFLNN
ncbi:hypothetical protein [Staphylococcus ureilyticus]|uniref:hypothetical protein n=1 Tax=Staphylococcus ureilyticus TaxID=94138 RepID=UPI000C53F9BC|nr:hypothetical protein [Staphylococcus ureilyticus]PIS62249.1 hypothetical protein AZH47_10260 [Corynebacterium striatum]